MKLSRALLAAALLAVAAPAAAADYTIDPAHTQAQFTVVHLAISKVHGQIPVAAGVVQADSRPGIKAAAAPKAAARMNSRRSLAPGVLRAKWPG